MSDITSQLPSAPPAMRAHSPADLNGAGRAITPTQLGLRLWPAVVIVALLWAVIKIPSYIVPGTMTQFMAMFWGPIVGTLAFVSWWLLASRIRWADRWIGLLASAVTGAIAFYFFHPSLGLFGVIMHGLPMVTTAWVLWLLVTPFVPWQVRRLGLPVVFVLVWGYFTLVRFDGVDGSMNAELTYRWVPTAEQKFQAEYKAPPVDASSAKPVVLQPGDWPGFRGPNRDGRLLGVRIATDWSQNPPRQLWRHRVGPGWSSFAVVGNRVYTQEQRGEYEVVVCYDSNSGEELWAAKATARFTEVVAGPGPRATPTFSDGKIYALGAAGKLSCLDAAKGTLQWSHDILADSGAKLPQWGFASSPLVAEGVVTVFAGGPSEYSVLGYNAATGNLAWHGGEGELSYCSPQLTRLGGADQVLIATDVGLAAYHPATGNVEWRHDWPTKKGLARVVQPTVLDGSDVLLGTGFGMGTQGVHVSRETSIWASTEVWTSRAICPYFNDMVAHRGHLYGFDGNFFTCVSLEDGKGKWRARGYGNGQVLLLADQDLLLILTEKEGEVVLVDASPDAHNERGRFKAIEWKKTWNHPVIAHGKLFVRNGEEAACYQLTEIGSGTASGK